MQATRIDLMQGMPIFGAIREHVLAFLLEQARTVHVAAGEYFFREGDEALGMYVLEEGRAAVLKGWKGRELLLREMQRGDCFGEMALMDLQRHRTQARAPHASVRGGSRTVHPHPDEHRPRSLSASARHR
jgi:CRP-like cAMP-binding protein